MLAKKKKKLAKTKTPKQMERHFKGVANKRRIEMLFLIAENKGITLDGICQGLRCNNKTASEHTKKLVHAGLVNKYHKGRSVGHSLSPYGERFLKFINSF